jgi:L-seryl-tRNA(Ser) seleniumtransferase
LLALDTCLEEGRQRGVPVIVDAAAQSDLARWISQGADLVLASGHKVLGAPTSGLICGRKPLVRACYLQNWGIGRAMKVGKEGIAGLIAALDLWSRCDPQEECRRLQVVSAAIEAGLAGSPALRVESGEATHKIRVRVDHSAARMTAQQLANCLREGRPAIWVEDAVDSGGAGTVTLDLRRLSPQEADLACKRILENLGDRPGEDVPYHDLYRSLDRLLRWPD